MRRVVINLLVLTVVIYILGTETGLFTIDGWWSALAGALVLALLNQLIRPLVVVLTMPVSCLTLGLFLLVINGVMLMLASWLVPHFETYGFWRSVLAALIISLITTIINGLLRTDGKHSRGGHA